MNLQSDEFQSLVILWLYVGEAFGLDRYTMINILHESGTTGNSSWNRQSIRRRPGETFATEDLEG